MHGNECMKLAQLKKFPVESFSATPGSTGIRGTDAQDAARAPHVPPWWRQRAALAVAAAGLVLLILVLAVKGWLGTAQVIGRERLRLATVTRGHFVRDVAGEAQVYHLSQRRFLLNARPHRLVLLKQLTRELAAQEVEESDPCHRSRAQQLTCPDHIAGTFGQAAHAAAR